MRTGNRADSATGGHSKVTVGGHGVGGGELGGAAADMAVAERATRTNEVMSEGATASQRGDTLKGGFPLL